MSGSFSAPLYSEEILKLRNNPAKKSFPAEDMREEAYSKLWPAVPCALIGCGTTYCCDMKDRRCLHMQQRWAEEEGLLVVMVKEQRGLHDQQLWVREER